MANLSQIELIESIKYPCLRTRVKNEYNELKKIYGDSNKHELFVSYDNTLDETKITLLEQINNNNYVFILDKNYPFYSPKFYFNNQPYTHYLKLPSRRFSEVLKKFTNTTCLCCSSLSCKYNWSPAIKLRMFIEELKKIRQYKRHIVYKILSEQLKDKYLIDDVDLDSFLY
jgi:hypothetical protein